MESSQSTNREPSLGERWSSAITWSRERYFSGLPRPQVRLSWTDRIAVPQPFGIQTASLVAVLGATSPAIGLALQGTLPSSPLASCCCCSVHSGSETMARSRAGEVALAVHDRTGRAETARKCFCQTAPYGEPRSSTGAAIINQSAYPGRTGASRQNRPNRRRLHLEPSSAGSAHRRVGPGRPRFQDDRCRQPGVGRGRIDGQRARQIVRH